MILCSGAAGLGMARPGSARRGLAGLGKARGRTAILTGGHMLPSRKNPQGAGLMITEIIIAIEGVAIAALTSAHILAGRRTNSDPA